MQSQEEPELINVEQILKHYNFLIPSFSIYEGGAGLFDYGPLGCHLKNNLITAWRNFFSKEDFDELQPSLIVGFDVLKASGHVDRFCDLMTFDSVNGEFYRADHLIKKYLPNENTDLPPKYLTEIIRKNNLKSDKGNDLTDVIEFNLIFQTNLGPKRNNIAFLRPETAQGQFTSFFKLNRKVPFGTFSIGKVFRNEISPRNMLRLREFEQIEIEYFVDPLNKNKDLSKFSEDELPFLINNEVLFKKVKDLEISGILLYFLIRSYQFLLKIGIDKKYLRIRQHNKDEMSHYALDCYDLEIKTSLGWIECVGIADRSDYDLKQHIKHSKQSIKCRREVNKKIFSDGKYFIEEKDVLNDQFYYLNENNEFKLFNESLELEKNISKFNISSTEFEPTKNADVLKQPTNSDLELLKNNKNIIDGSESHGLKNNKEIFKLHFSGNLLVSLISDKKSYNLKQTIITSEPFIPHVIEPSFGIDRLIYCLAEHSFKKRSDSRSFFAFNELMSPYLLEMSFLVKSKPLIDLLDTINVNCTYKKNYRSVSIGKKYSVADEIGIRYYLTVDNQSLIDQSVTIRDRDTMEQIRVRIVELNEVFGDLKNGWKKFN